MVLQRIPSWQHGRRIRVFALAAAFALIASGCGDDQNDSGASQADGLVAPEETVSRDTLEPVSGGSITMSVFSQTRALDPIASSGSGTAGGTELAALYDTIMRYNPETKSYEPQTAESLEHNDDYTRWTLKLRPGIKFQDGTDYDAEAVRLSFVRHKGPENTVNPSRGPLVFVNEPTVVDKLTVEFTLTTPWPDFPYLLADEPGMLVSPTALAALGDPSAPDYKAKKDAFNLKPVGAGAGPFKIVEFTPGEGIIMERNPDYWGGEVYLDELRFILLPSNEIALEYLKSDQVQVAFLRSPKVAAQAKRDGFDGWENVQQAADFLLINNGVAVTCKGGAPAPLCDGKADGTSVATTPPGANLTVRKAIAAAVDPALVNERAYDGEGLAGNALFGDSFLWSPGVAGPTYDPTEAKRLVEQAKAEGWDGHIRFLCTNQPKDRVDLAQAVTTMLQSVGFDVELVNNIDVAQQINEVNINKNFELSCSGIGVSNDPGAALTLHQNFSSTSPTNRAGYNSQEWDRAIVAALGAETDEDKVDAYRTLAEIYNRDVPVVVLGAIPEYVAWSDKVHGIYPNHATIVYFDDAWVES